MRVLSFTVVLLLTACGSPMPRQQINQLNTLVEVTHLDLNQFDWSLRITNRQKTTRNQASISCQLTTNNQIELAFDPLPLPDLSSHISERLEVRSLPMPKDESLFQPEITYQLHCQLNSENFATEDIIISSVLHQVPSQAGVYR